MKITRRQILATIGSIPLAGVALGAYTRFFEPDWLEVTEKRIRIDTLSKPIRILHLSDFHASKHVGFDFIEKAIDTGLQQNPDLAFLTGDFITEKLGDHQEYARILAKLSAAIPSFACVGNHDGGPWAGSTYGYKDFSKIRALIEASGIELLHNEKRVIDIHGQTICIAGLGDLWNRHCLPQEVLEKKRAKSIPHFVLSHNPDSKELLEPYDWDLVCCGHTHGGQLVIPLLDIRPFLPVSDKSFPEGILSWGKRHIHITRGVGNLHGMRFNCRPEISLLHLSQP